MPTPKWYLIIEVIEKNLQSETSDIIYSVLHDSLTTDKSLAEKVRDKLNETKSPLVEYKVIELTELKETSLCG